MKWQTLANAAACLVLFVTSAAGKKITEANEDNCEVCVKFLTRFIDSLDGSIKTDQKGIEAEFKRTCKSSRKDDNRFCYYVGGLEESATGIVSEMSKPISWGMPAEKVCMKLFKKDPQICDLKYEKTIDLAAVDLKKMKVRDLKAILSDWNEKCKGCTEKSDYIALIEQLMPKYAPEAHAKRSKIEL